MSNIAIDLSQRPVIANGFRLQWEKAQNAYVLLYPEGMVQLNESAGEILNACDGQRAVLQLIEYLESEFGATDLHNDIVDFLQHAIQQGWIECI